MTRNLIRSKWDLPDEVEPATERCFLIHIPNDPKYVAAFKGAMYSLTKPYAWGDDDAHTALLVGAHMQLAYSSIEEVDCEGSMLLRACTLDCGIEYSTDGGDTWTCISLANCIGDLVNSGISQAIEDGLLQRRGTQQGPTSAPSAGACKTYHVVLNPGARWHVPSPMVGNDTIQITNASGGWSVGELAWYCPDGARYLLGTCDSSLHTHVTGDLLNPGAWHMALIGLVGSTYFDPLTSIYSIAANTPSSDVYIMANTGLTGTPSGQVEFDVTVCSGAEWEHTFDFTLGKQGWVTDSYPDNFVAGQGWEQAFWSGPNNFGAGAKRTFSLSIITHVEMTWDGVQGATNRNAVIFLYKTNTQQARVDYGSWNTGTLTWQWNGLVQSDDIRLSVLCSDFNSRTGSVRLFRCIVRGRGVDPF